MADPFDPTPYNTPIDSGDFCSTSMKTNLDYIEARDTHSVRKMSMPFAAYIRAHAHLPEEDLIEALHMYNLFAKHRLDNKHGDIPPITSVVFLVYRHTFAPARLNVVTFIENVDWCRAVDGQYIYGTVVFPSFELMRQGMVMYFNANDDETYHLSKAPNTIECKTMTMNSDKLVPPGVMHYENFSEVVRQHRDFWDPSIFYTFLGHHHPHIEEMVIDQWLWYHQNTDKQAPIDQVITVVKPHVQRNQLQCAHDHGELLHLVKDVDWFVTNGGSSMWIYKGEGYDSLDAMLGAMAHYLSGVYSNARVAHRAMTIFYDEIVE